jgi:signal transduction histidine kinase
MDQIVGTLREVPAPDDVEAPTSLASVNTLVARHAAAGLRVTVDVSGQPRPLPTATDQAAFRILQESLTNAARHGAGRARVTLMYRDTSVELTVTNPVRTDAATASRAGGGHGIIGMHERATLLGGTLEAHRRDGHFRVHAEIPAGGHRP